VTHYYFIRLPVSLILIIVCILTPFAISWPQPSAEPDLFSANLSYTPGYINQVIEFDRTKKKTVFCFYFQTFLFVSFDNSIATNVQSCHHFEFHILLIQLALLTVCSFMHLYFLLKAFIMIITAVCYVCYSYYFLVYNTIANAYGLTSGLLLIQTTVEVMFFILLLIGLDRRVN